MKAIRRRLDAQTKAAIEEQKVAARNPSIHHYIGVNENTRVSLFSFNETPGGDPLGKVGR